MTQTRLAENFPRYLAGSWSFAHDHPGTGACFISALLYCCCLLFCILQIILLGAPEDVNIIFLHLLQAQRMVEDIAANGDIPYTFRLRT